MKSSKIYAETLEDSALEQFNDAMAQPFVVKGALMPDAHTGYSLPIGAVVQTNNVVVPAWVGYDIGCGMLAVPTSFKKADVENNKVPILRSIYAGIPTGFSIRGDSVVDLNTDALSPAAREIYLYRDKGRNSLGTLGSGNHFIEVGADTNEQVWIIIHSGSRGVGYKTAEHYMKLASGSDKPKEGHYGFDPNSPHFESYVKDLNWFLDYALLNRKVMMLEVQSVMQRILGEGSVKMDLIINSNHNHAEYIGDGQWVHRKGATQAGKHQLGVIPGNMLDGTYIVCGKGEPDSLCSSSHGAGRVLGRKQAQRVLDLDAFKQRVHDSGVAVFANMNTIEESPDAYKDIHEVIRLQQDLVDIVTYVEPILVVKDKD